MYAGVADDLGVSAMTVVKWRERFGESRLEGLADTDRPGRPKSGLALAIAFVSWPNSQETLNVPTGKEGGASLVRHPDEEGAGTGRAVAPRLQPSESISISLPDCPWFTGLPSRSVSESLF